MFRKFPLVLNTVIMSLMSQYDRIGSKIHIYEIPAIFQPVSSDMKNILPLHHKPKTYGFLMKYDRYNYHYLNTYAGLCRGCVLGTFSTLKSGMSRIILAVGANVPTYLRIMNGNITEVSDPRKVTNIPIFFNGMGHLSPFLQSLGITLHLTLTLGNLKWNLFRSIVIYKLILVIDGWSISCEIALRCVSLDFTDDKSTLVQVMAWCCLAASHHTSNVDVEVCHQMALLDHNELNNYQNYFTHTTNKHINCHNYRTLPYASKIIKKKQQKNPSKTRVQLVSTLFAQEV